MNTISCRSFRILSLVICLALLPACAAPASPTPFPTIGAARSTGQVKPGMQLGNGAVVEECQFGRQGDEDDNNQDNRVTCGVLTVPADRQHPTDQTIKLHFVVFKSTAAAAPGAPLLFLSGRRFFGGGFFFQDSEIPVDMVIMDERGSGSSEPSLDCPAADELFTTNLDQDPYTQQAINQRVETDHQCYDELLKSGAVLDAYTTTASAADFDALRAALGYTQWNVFSSGSGTRLALTLLRDYPQSIRSLVVDSAVPPQVNTALNSAVYAGRSLALLFQRCSEDAQCQKAFPDLQKVLYDVVDQLNRSPVTVKVSDLSAGRTYDVWVDGNRLLNLTLQILDRASSYELPQLPRMIYQVKNGKYDQLSTSLGSLSYDAPRTLAAQMLAFCKEDLRAVSRDQINQSNDSAESSLADFYAKELDLAYELCAVWDPAGSSSTKLPALNKDAAVGSVPVLFLVGDFAISAPAEWSKQAASSLTHALVVEFAGAGSSVMSSTSSQCASQIITAFMENPQSQPDISCASAKKSYLWVTLP